MSLGMPGWNENNIYPGTHWLFYNQKGDYIARIDFDTWTEGKYKWRVFGKSGIKPHDRIGFCDSLDEAKQQTELVLSSPNEAIFFQNKLF